MSFFSSKSSKTVKTYSSGGPAGGYSKTTETVTDDGGTRTKTYTMGDPDKGIGISGGFQDGGFGVKGGIAGMGNMSLNTSTGGKIKFSKSEPEETTSRYKSGWGGRKSKAPSGPPVKLEGKTYDDIKAECLSKGCLFEDPDFQAVDKTIFYSRAPPRPFVWKRPGEICSDPQLFVGGASRFDVQQGELGDCWLLAAVASLCQHKDLLYRVVPKDQSFTDGYAGIFHFQFWQYGEWTDVIIDDRLPTYYDKLVFMHSADSNEFWTPLLEKAYAKLVGSYEALKGGSTCEAMEDFTGGVTEMFDFRQSVPNGMFDIMLKAHARCSLMGCSIEADPNQLEAELPNGLIMGHAYSVTDVKLVDVKTSTTTGQIPMVRVRNPWGNEAEWNGAWSDKSQEWQFISEAERKEIGLTFSDDGEFWMAFKDFSKNFQKLEICNLGPEGEDTGRAHFEATQLEGGWIRRVNAGGCRNYLDTFWTNPQYRVHVVDCDDDDDEMGTIIVALMQKNRRKKREEGLDLLTMGYCIYKLEGGKNDNLDMKFFKYNGSVAKSPSFINMREICGRHKLPPGHYCILPSTFEPNQEGDFIVRVFSEKPNVSSEIDEETGMTDIQPKQQLTEDDKRQEQGMKAAFKNVAGDDMEIDAYELQGILDTVFKKEFAFDGFSADTCRSLVAMMDVDQSGKLGFDEFKKLWTDLRMWKTVFKEHDADQSGNFNSYELRSAYRTMGLKVSNGTFNALVMRYAHKDGKIFFDDYIHCTARLKLMFNIFKETDVMNEGKAEFTLDQFIQTTMYS